MRLGEFISIKAIFIVWKVILFQKINFTNPGPLNPEPINLKVYNYGIFQIL